MNKDAVRACPVVFAATWNTTVPVPVPEAPLVMVRKLALLVAVHAQSLDVVTVTLPVPPVASNDRSVPESENVQPWTTVPVIVGETETQGGADPVTRPTRTHGATSTYVVMSLTRVADTPADKLPVVTSRAEKVTSAMGAGDVGLPVESILALPVRVSSTLKVAV